MSDGTGRIYQRGNIWWIDYSFRGERHRESTGSTKKKDAKALLRKRMKEMGDGGPMVNEEEVEFSDLRDVVVTDYKVNGRKSLDRVQLAFDHLEDYLSGVRAVDLTKDRIMRYVAARQEEGAANATINKELAALRRAYNLMQEAGRLSRGPHVPTLETNNTRTGFLTMGDVDAICEEIGPDLSPVVRFAALTGWRKGEIIAFRENDGLRWRQVDFEAGTVHLDPGSTKNDEGRTFPFSALPPLEELLRRQRERTDTVERSEGTVVPHVFHRSGDPIKSMRGAWKGATKRAGLEGALFHDLRRTAVRNLERAGVPRSVAKKLTGHKTDSVYERYAIADQSALEEGVEKLARLHQEDEEKDREGRTTIPLEEAK